MKYLRKFETEAEKEVWLNSENYVQPNVVLTGGTVAYNLVSPAAMPMYIEALEDLTIKFSKSYEYSKDNITWTSATSSTLISASSGERVFFRASGLTVSSTEGIGRFTISNGTCNIGGNVMSMIYGSDYENKTEITAPYQFRNLFHAVTWIIDASTLVLPATTLTSGCYLYMFYGCTSLVNAPVLPATTLAESCYQFMFAGCTNLVNAPVLPATTLAKDCYFKMFKDCGKLSYVKAMFKSTPGSYNTDDWLYGVAATGTFVKNAAATWNVTGVDGIPSGWTVETAEA